MSVGPTREILAECVGLVGDSIGLLNRTQGVGSPLKCALAAIPRRLRDAVLAILTRVPGNPDHPAGGVAPSLPETLFSYGLVPVSCQKALDVSRMDPAGGSELVIRQISALDPAISRSWQRTSAALLNGRRNEPEMRQSAAGTRAELPGTWRNHNWKKRRELPFTPRNTRTAKGNSNAPDENRTRDLRLERPTLFATR
jgi:hypothetical protein